MKPILIFFALALTACTDRNETRSTLVRDNYCTQENAEQRADFILSCIANANPKSDEEPEDWIELCQKMAEDTICEKRTFEVIKLCGSSTGCNWWQEVGRQVVE